MQDSVECAGPQKYNGESPVFTRCMVLEIQLFHQTVPQCSPLRGLRGEGGADQNECVILNSGGSLNLS